MFALLLTTIDSYRKEDNFRNFQHTSQFWTFGAEKLPCMCVQKDQGNMLILHLKNKIMPPTTCINRNISISTVCIFDSGAISNMLQE